jgi:hypothetical protein
VRYLLIHCIDESTVDWNDDGSSVDPEEDRAVAAWDKEMTERGIVVGGGFLRPTSDATTVRVRGGEVLIADGPFAETKEQIAGYTILECANLDDAIEVASRHPTAQIGTFELRPYWD